jgi:drug/metabolite transporter (DMT)-like permease
VKWMKSLRVDVLGLAFVLIWSSGYLVGALATEVIAPLAVTLWRFLVAALALAAIARLRGERWPRGRELAGAALVGVPMFAVQFGALYTALAEGMPASTTSLIACSSPLLVATVGVALRWERLTLAQWAGVGIGLVGLIITLADRVSRPPGAAALAWTLLGLAALAMGTIMQSRLRHGAGPTAIASVELAIGAAILAAWAPLRGPVSMPLTAHALGSFAWLALVTGIGAPLLLFALIRQRGATRASSYLFIVPAVTALGAWPILGIPIEPTTIAGLGVSAGGLWLASPARAAARARRSERDDRFRLVPADTSAGTPVAALDRT